MALDLKGRSVRDSQKTVRYLLATLQRRKASNVFETQQIALGLLEQDNLPTVYKPHDRTTSGLKLVHHVLKQDENTKPMRKEKFKYDPRNYT